MNILTNKYQTPITDELLLEYPEEVREQLFDFINGVDFIKWLISPDRPYAKDCPHDEQGRVIVDLAHPHIIEDADYFRPAALHFMKHGCYTFLRPNSNPHSEYRKFWAEEIRRCYEGYVRESDGEWVTGLCYWFLNYNPMLVNKIVPGSKRAERVESFPFFFEGIYWRFHYLQQAKLAGQHAIELARRQCAKSYSLSSIMTHNLILGEADPNPETHRRRTTVLTAYEKEYLKDDKDGTFSKFKPALGFIFTHTPYPHLMLKNSPNEMSWQMGYKNELGVDAGSLNQVLGVSAKDNPDKLRGKRGWVLFEEMGSFKGLLALYDTTRKGVEDGNYAFATMYLVGCVCAGTKVWTLDGRFINIEDLNKEDGIIGFSPNVTVSPDNGCSLFLTRGVTKEPILSNINTDIKECVRVTLNNGNVICCSKDHPIFTQKQHFPRNGTRYYEEVFKSAGDLQIGDRVLECREVGIFGKESLFDARLVGMLVGDGTYGKKSSVGYCSEDPELLEYIKTNYPWKYQCGHITKKGNNYEEGRIPGLVPKLREIGIYEQTKCNKRLPNNYQTLNKEDTILLLSGLYDTDGSVVLAKKDGYLYLTQSNREILEQVKILWRKFGVIGTITKTNPRISEDRKDKNPWYTLVVSGRHNLTRAAKVLKLLVTHKRNKLIEISNWYENNPSQKEQNYSKDIIVSRVKSVEDLGEQTVYNLTAGLSHTYLANNIITHNTAAEDESDFSSAKTLLYSPSGYNIYSIPNVFDKRGQGNKEFGFFFPSYINRSGCYNKDGVSDVVKALLEILLARYKAKYSADPQSVLRVIAEDPITPAEAIIKVKASYFPTASLTERLAQLDEDPKAFNDVYVGELVLRDGEVVFTPTGDIPIHKYGVNNTTRGALEIFEMPEKNREGKVFTGRYIIGHDPVDNDQAESSSLSSTFVFDLFTDKIVAEYTGRQPFADDNFEIVRKLCLFYNAKCLYESNKKGIFAYFSKLNCTHLLAETPEYLRDKQFIKYSNFGSNRYGVNAGAAINDYANGLLRDWLLTPHTVIVKSPEGNLIEQSIPMLYTIRNRALLEELISYTPELNVDRIRAMGMVMLYRQEKIILYKGDMSPDREERANSDYLGNDKFFTNNYDRRFLNKQ